MLGGILQLEAIKTILLIPARNKKKKPLLSFMGNFSPNHFLPIEIIM